MAYTTISPICTSCQSPIGHVFPLYNIAKNIQVDEYLERKGYKATDNSAMESINMGEFLTKNDITNSCCRVQILGHNLIIQDTI